MVMSGQAVASIFAQLAVLTSAYETWHMIDVASVVCPGAGDTAFPAYTIGIDQSASMNMQVPHVFSILRAATSEVSVSFTVTDASNTQVVSKTVTLNDLGDLTVAATCVCSGQTATFDNAADYGGVCQDWDNARCNTLWPNDKTGPWCCKNWCYAASDCPDALPSSLVTGGYYSYAACSQPLATATCAWQPPDPCGCQSNVRNFFTDDMLQKFSSGYGTNCFPWDIDTCETNYAASLLDDWCCSNWCYVTSECSTGIASLNEGVDLFWSSSACSQDSGVLSQCTYRPTNTVNVTSAGLDSCACITSTDPLPAGLAAIGFSSDYGQLCAPHDAYDCQSQYPGVAMGIWCCTSWCYVDSTCPHKYESSLWPGKFWSGFGCEDDEDVLSQCLWSDDCKCQNSNTGLVRDANGKTAIDSGYMLSADYGKTCGKWDSADCWSLWGPNAGTYNVWGGFKNDWCCAEWCYVHDNCPVATQSAFGAPPYLYAACAATTTPQYYSVTIPYAVPPNTATEGTCVDVPASPQTSFSACQCLGETPPSANKPTGAPADYGQTCAAWDSENCETYYPDSVRGMYCCLPWCYVSPECPNAQPSSLWENHYYTSQYSDLTCAKESFETSVRTCKYSSACNCLGKNGDFTRNGIPADYGTSCSPWDAVGCNAMWGTETYWDSTGSNDWCCENWCYVSFSCPLSSGTSPIGMSYTYGAACAPNSDTYNAPPADTCTSRRLEESQMTVKGDAPVASTGFSVVNEQKEFLAEPSSSQEPVEVAKVEAGIHAEEVAFEPIINGSENWLSCRRRRIATCGGNHCCCEDRSSPLCKGGGIESESLNADGVHADELDILLALLPTPRARRGKGSSGGYSGGWGSSPRPAPYIAPPARRRSPSRPVSDTRRRYSPPRRRDVRRRSPPAPAPVRRRASTVTGRSGYTAASTSSPRRRGSQGNPQYGYTSRPELMNNYGGNMPSQTSYGYSGRNAYPSGSQHQTAMYSPSHNRYNSYNSYDNYDNNNNNYYGGGGYNAYHMNTYSDSRRRSGRVLWCFVPELGCSWLDNGWTAGDIVECSPCNLKCGSCLSTDECYGSSGCSYKSQASLARDDMMETGFIPSEYTLPLTVTFSSISGTGFSKADVCPSVDNAEPTLKMDLFLTLTAQDFVGDPYYTATTAPGSGSGDDGGSGTLANGYKIETGTCKVNTGHSPNNGVCGDGEESKMLQDPGDGQTKKMCGCKSGWCMEGVLGSSSAVCHEQNRAGAERMEPLKSLTLLTFFMVATAAGFVRK